MAKDAHSRETYHHGNLPEALVREGARLLAEGGIDGFSLRKLAERTGVTVAAPSHHFGSAKGLLTAIATRGFDDLADQMDIAGSSTTSPPEAVTAICLASAFRAFGRLENALAKALPPAMAPEQIALKAKALWAATHGLSVLPMIDGPEAEQIIKSAVAAHLGGSLR